MSVAPRSAAGFTEGQPFGSDALTVSVGSVTNKADVDAFETVLAAVGARDDGVSALAAALAATGAAHLAPLHLSTSPIACCN